MSPLAHSNLRGSILLGLVYFALAASTILYSRYEGGVAFVWFAGAALLARLLSLRPRHWGVPLSCCAVGGALATGLFGLGPAATLPMLVPTLADPAIAALLVRRLSGPGGSFASQGRLLVFLLAAAVIAPAVTGLLAAGVAVRFGTGGYWSNWIHWYAGHALGAVTFTPLAHYVARGGAAKWFSRANAARITETVALVSLVALVSVVTFAQQTLPLLFLPILPITLAIFRGGRLPAALSILALTLVAGAFTAAGKGPMNLLHLSPGARMQFLQFYLAMSVLTVLPAATELGRRRALFRALRDSEARYRLLAENSTDIILNLDIDGTIRFASPSITQISGYQIAQVLGRNAMELIEPDDVEAVRAAHRNALVDTSRTFIVEYRANVGEGSLRWFETHTRAVLEGATVVGVVCAIRDVTHRKTLEERLSHAASTDPLTGLANRRTFATALEAEIARTGSAGGCVAVFDLDHFKRVNDRFGHAAGDSVLKSFAQQARRCVREHDIVARLGGEEFAIILPGATRLQAQRVCERLLRNVAAMEVRVGAAIIRITASGGVACYHDHSSPEALLASADAALYDAKAKGRDRLAFAA